MADQISTENLSNLYSAEEVKSVADSADSYFERCTVARVINLAANTGAKSVVYNNPMSDSMAEELKSQGYTITAGELGLPLTISWK